MSAEHSLSTRLDALASHQAQSSSINAAELHLNIRQKIALTSPRLRALLQRCISHWRGCVSESQLRDSQRTQRARHFVRHWHYRVFLHHANQQYSISSANMHNIARLGRLFFRSMSDETLESWERMLDQAQTDYLEACVAEMEVGQSVSLEVVSNWRSSANWLAYSLLTVSR